MPPNTAMRLDAVCISTDVPKCYFLRESCFSPNHADPRVAYDSYNNRYVMMWLARRESDFKSYWLVSVSKNANPTVSQDWCRYALDAKLNGNETTDTMLDFPSMSIDGLHKVLYITGNMFDQNDGAIYVTHKVRTLNLDQMYRCENVQGFTLINFLNPDGTKARNMQAVQPDGQPADQGYLVNRMNTNSLILWKIADPLGNPTITKISIGVDAFTEKRTARQPSGEPVINNPSPSLTNAHYRNGFIWATQDIASATGNDMAIRLYKISENGSGETRNLGADGFDYAYGAASTDIFDNVAFVFSRSAPTEFLSIRFGGVKNDGTAVGSQIMKAGLSNYIWAVGNTRWGDYGGIATDPDGIHFWMFHAFMRMDEEWGGWVARAVYTPPIFLPLVTR